MRNRNITVVIAMGLFLGSGSSFGAGLEKNIMWSGKHAGAAGAAVSTADGAEAVFFNPAGIANGKAGSEVSVNFSPGIHDFSAPNYSDSAKMKSGYNLVPVFGVVGSYGLTPKWGVGIGMYVSAGARAIFNAASLGITGFDMTPKLQSYLDVSEVALGTGYEIADGLRLGAAFRVVMAQGSFSMAQVVGSNLIAVDLKNLSATRFSGLKLGLSYTAPDKTWGFGVAWRNQLDFIASGQSTGSVQAAGPGATSTLAEAPAKVGLTLPQQFVVGGNYELIKGHLRTMVEYVWTNYSENKTLVVEASPGGVAVSNVSFNWANQSEARIGFECTAVKNWAFRAGYVYSSQVVPKETALAILSSPGAYNTFVAGAGTMIGSTQVDGAFEYSAASGTGGTSSGFLGTYSTTFLTLHMGATFRF
ncbi:outer membrane protein transport protein [bacterium]|jgi:hypothetical protein|nr:outer membrane protein transport protein [bacterium]